MSLRMKVNVEKHKKVTKLIEKSEQIKIILAQTFMDYNQRVVSIKFAI